VRWRGPIRICYFACLGYSIKSNEIKKVVSWQKTRWRHTLFSLGSWSSWTSLSREMDDRKLTYLVLTLYYTSHCCPRFAAGDVLCRCGRWSSLDWEFMQILGKVATWKGKISKISLTPNEISWGFLFHPSCFSWYLSALRRVTGALQGYTRLLIPLTEGLERQRWW